ncbi:MAG: lytic murein transglycosylase [Alphaproteobacteria bacterium]|nr:lytic murein transglycosylase [Alphaproteobacteria bacterium]
MAVRGRVRLLGAILLAMVVLLKPLHSSDAGTQDFHLWLNDLRQEAFRYGISEKLILEALPFTLVPDVKVIRLDRKQPENTVSFTRYKKNVLTKARIKEGRFMMKKHKTLLNRIGKDYGVEPRYIVALWGIETNFGKNTGGFEVIPALVTLAYDGRRGEFFRRELLKALSIVDQGNIELYEMKGSWAGAMGQCQFMPTSFENFAEDYNRDGRRDIWNTKADVFASAARYLSSNGWKAWQPWGHRVRLPVSFNNKLIGMKIKKSSKFLNDAGVRLLNGKKVPSEGADLVSVVQPGGKGYKTYIVYDNYRGLLKWNSSLYFATIVGLFADELKS